MKSAVVLLLGVLGVLYLLNPAAGIFELIPDTLPLVGNLDEAAAMALVIMCLKHFGIELPDIFGRRKVGRRK